MPGPKQPPRRFQFPETPRPERTRTSPTPRPTPLSRKGRRPKAPRTTRRPARVSAALCTPGRPAPAPAAKGRQAPAQLRGSFIVGFAFQVAEEHGALEFLGQPLDFFVDNGLHLAPGRLGLGPGLAWGPPPARVPGGRRFSSAGCSRARDRPRRATSFATESFFRIDDALRASTMSEPARLTRMSLSVCRCVHGHKSGSEFGLSQNERRGASARRFNAPIIAFEIAV